MSEADDPNREQECLIALAANFRCLTAAAAAAGWTKEEIAFSLLELTRHEIRSLMSLGADAAQPDARALQNKQPSAGNTP
jgi:hypothetical protein